MSKTGNSPSGLDFTVVPYYRSESGERSSDLSQRLLDNLLERLLLVWSEQSRTHLKGTRTQRTKSSVSPTHQTVPEHVNS